MKNMNKNNTKFLRIALVVFIMQTTAIVAQEGKIRKADNKYESLAYIDAAAVYLDVAESGYRSEELLKKLGNSFYFNSMYTEAAKWYGELFTMTQSVEPIYYLRYSQSLKATGNKSVAAKWYDKYLEKTGSSNEDFKTASDYEQIINMSSGRYSLQPVAINTNGIEYGGAFTGDKLVVTSTGSTGRGPSKVNAWDGLSYLDLYEATIKNDGTLEALSKLKGDINTKYHESSAVFTKDGKTMYFTRNNTSPKTRRNKKETQHLKIYRAHLVDEEWTNIEDLSINGDDYDTAHPALNSTEDTLYFVSNMSQSIGLTDIFMVNLGSDGTLGNPVNLGDKVNTGGRESFPFITEDNELYFSSDGHFGLGGYDVFYIKLKGSEYEGSLLNLGKPINSAFDDIAFVINDHKGFISSNRLGGKGYDDIYGFVEHEDIQDLLKSKVYGIVTDKDTKQPLPNATIIILSENNEVVNSIETDSTGYYESEIDPSALYIIKANKAEYDGDDVFSQKSIEPREHNFELSRNVFDIDTGDDIATILNIVIYFDLNKDNIRPDAQVELEKLVSVLKNNPNLKIDVRSHTDSRANDNYNMKLSNRRAKSTIDYLVSRGIERSRLSGRGYGESFLLNSCSNGMDCSEDEHQQNRRSEFIITNK